MAEDIETDIAGDEFDAPATPLGPSPDDEALERLLAWPFGRLVVWQILQHCGVYRTSYVGGPGQGEMSAYLEGRRSVGLFLIDWLERVDRRAYPQLILEQMTKAEEQEQNHD